MNQLQHHIQTTLIRASLIATLFFIITPVWAVLPSGSRMFLDHWSFNITNGFPTYYGYSAWDYTNVSTTILGDFSGVVLDGTNTAFLHYHCTEPSTGTNELTVDIGSISLWAAPASWRSSGSDSSATGPGKWARLIEVGDYSTNSPTGWWSLLVDPAGTNIYFCSQSNDGSGGTYLSAPISWSTNEWHNISLTYSATNTSLYIDGDLATNGLPLTAWPGPDVLTNGFYVGGDSSGNAGGFMIDDLFTYGFELDSNAVASLYVEREPFYRLNPMNSANFVSAPSQPSQTPVFNAVTGPGVLNTVGTITNCISSNSVWIADLVVTPGSSNDLRNINFSIKGGINGLFYDVFANSVLDFSTNTALAWAWEGQGQSCTRYTITNLPAGTCYLILGTPVDADADGLTDAYEGLVSKTDPTKPDTIGDGITDGWKVALSMNALLNSPKFQGSRSNFTYDPVGRLDLISGVRAETLTNDFEGNILLSR